MQKLIKRRRSYLHQISKIRKLYPICGILGPRQVGKTTLAEQFAKQYAGDVHFFDLQKPIDRARLENPSLPYHR